MPSKQLSLVILRDELRKPSTDAGIRLGEKFRLRTYFIVGGNGRWTARTRFDLGIR